MCVWCACVWCACACVCVCVCVCDVCVSLQPHKILNVTTRRLGGPVEMGALPYWRNSLHIVTSMVPVLILHTMIIMTLLLPLHSFLLPSSILSRLLPISSSLVLSTRSSPSTCYVFYENSDFNLNRYMYMCVVCVVCDVWYRIALIFPGSKFLWIAVFDNFIEYFSRIYML